MKGKDDQDGRGVKHIDKTTHKGPRTCYNVDVSGSFDWGICVVTLPDLVQNPLHQ